MSSMSCRRGPGRFVEAVVVDLPRPRTLDMMTDPRFGALVDRIRSRLDKERSYDADRAWHRSRAR